MSLASYYTQQPSLTDILTTSDHSDPAQETAPINTFFVRALYDYQSNDASSLSFHSGDIIEVLTQLETGWWDGLLDDERGWFPSNYVVIVSDQEVEEELNARAGLASMVSLTEPPSPARNHSQEGDQDQWLESELSLNPNNLLDQLINEGLAPHDSQQENDFWVPRFDPSGQISYVNTRTGEESRDLPLEGAGSNHAGYPAALATQQARTREANAGNDLSRRSGTPEPWEKRLADDGMSYYYYNTVTGSSRWTSPTPESPQRAEGDYRKHSNGSQSAFGALYAHSDSDLDSSIRRLSVCSDDSDIHPSNTFHSPMTDHSAVHSKASPSTEDLTSFDLNLAQSVARELQSRLAPPPPETIAALSIEARDAIQAILTAINANGHDFGPNDDESERSELEAMTERVAAAVVAVRQLLYVSGTLLSPLTSQPSHSTVVESADTHRTPLGDLKPPQRKVTATLSKLVLSARAATFDLDRSPGEAAFRVGADVEELERAVMTFISAIQKASAYIHTKRLRGVLESAEGPSGVGPGLLGAGFAGQWRGSGFISLDDIGVPAPQRPLEWDFLAEIKRLGEELLETMSPETVATESKAEADRVIVFGGLIVARMSAFTALIEDADVAAHVDVDGLDLGSLDEGGEAARRYAASVQRACTLVRELEVTKQALYDDTMALFMASQAASPQTFHNRDSNRWDLLASSLTSLRLNIVDILTQFTVLSDIGIQQTKLAASGVPGRRGSRSANRSTSPTPSSSGPAGPSRYRESTLSMESDSATFIDLADVLGTSTSRELLDGGYYSDAAATNGMRMSHARTVSSTTQTTIAPSGLSVNTKGARKSEETSFSDEPDDMFDDLDEEELGGRPNPKNPKSPNRGAKIIRLLGKEAPMHYIKTQNVDSIPWYLRPEHGRSEILLHPDGSVRGGTLPALIERLTMHDTRDSTFNSTFLLTFRSFATIDEVFELLVKRFSMKPPEGLTQEELPDWVEKKREPVRLRVINILKSVLTEPDILEQDDLHILEPIKDWANSVANVAPAAKQQLIPLAERVKKGGDIIHRKMTITQVPPPPILPGRKKFTLLDVDPLEVARQLTIMESRLFTKIRPHEFLTRGKEGGGDDNVKAVITLTNQISAWVADSVLSAKDDPRRRAAVIKHFIIIADQCRTLQNFSSMSALIAALNSPPIYRLKRSWDHVGTKAIGLLRDVEKTLDNGSNFTGYRAMLATLTPPCVPFIGVYLTLLTFIQDGGKDILVKEGNLINFGKRQKSADVINEIKRYQAQPYNLTTVPAIFQLIEAGLHTDKTGDALWELSLATEPRERDDDRMVRLLQETGFI
ncbi:hypothetical protein BOTBODRAFT_178627 [Botryobasidium botryosum FD-172 SS1]|uniref:Ras GEF n=1 Tax=Botryobasidium botryosum (strain FD-172 SS1) TaxID=930990 RepID=A0A067M2X2_BOTB1|nr:hypothetical protein BOTBODRAFT_178627 [Botryobasidium botryosum FD-172 SS1]